MKGIKQQPMHDVQEISDHVLEGWCDSCNRDPKNDVILDMEHELERGSDLEEAFLPH